MAAGMLPSAMAYDAGGEVLAPMASAVIASLIVSRMLSFFFVPAVFLLTDDLGRLGARVLDCFVGPRDKAPGHAVIGPL